VVAGGAHTCALLDSGAVRCWGGTTNDGEGILGYGNDEIIGDDETPSSAGDVPLGGLAIQLAAGAQFTCALMEGGGVRCWGWNGFGQLGYGHTETIGDDETPDAESELDLGGQAIAVAAGGSHACAVMAGNELRCWGSNTFGWLGYGNTEDIGDDEAPASAGVVDVGGPVAQVVAGSSHTCALLTDGAVRCWGINADGVLGTPGLDYVGDDEAPGSIAPVDLGGPAMELAAGRDHNCVLMSDSSTVRCWGDGANGALGYAATDAIGDDESPSSAGDVELGGDAVRISSGSWHSCALLEDTSVRCWGRGVWGPLGYGNSEMIGDDETPASAGQVQVF
jgi:alpha-tubulin suppressor-like RCC1 family protein